MTVFGYHNSHEQFSPADLLRWTEQAEQAGFTAAFSSDHIAPWSESQGESGFTWSWLGAALARTSIPIGTFNAPGYRYHPAVIAHAIGTLGVMFPDRLFVAFGSGEALNEHITGERWPLKAERNERLKHNVQIIRALLAGETVTDDWFVTVHEAQIWTRPETMPALFGGALSVETARHIGTWADGMITVNADRAHLEAMIAAFREVAGDDAPVYIQSHLSFADTEEAARASAFEQWKTNVLAGDLGADVWSVRHFEAAAAHVRPEDMDGSVRISADLGRHREWIHEDIELGVQGIFLHNVGRNQAQFIDVFGTNILPEFLKG